METQNRVTLKRRAIILLDLLAEKTLSIGEKETQEGEREKTP